MSNVELLFFLVGGLAMLGLTIWSLRIRDFENRGDVRTPFLFGVFFALLFVVIAGRTATSILDLGLAQRVLAGLAAGSFSAGAILMFLRAFHMRRSAT